MDIALLDKSILIEEKVANFKLNNDRWSIEDYYYLNSDVIDSLTLTELINKAVIKTNQIWKKGDLENRYFIKQNQVLSFKQVVLEIDNLDNKNTKLLKKQIRQFNKKPRKWRRWPLSVSKPIFSDSGEFCIVGFVFGNSGGHTELYKKIENKWQQIAVINRYAF